jgi:hypothetical protein
LIFTTFVYNLQRHEWLRSALSPQGGFDDPVLGAGNDFAERNNGMQLRQVEPMEDHHDIQQRSLNIFSNLRWKARSSDVVVIPYDISSSFSNAERSRIVNAISSLADRSRVVQFVPRTN